MTYTVSQPRHDKYNGARMYIAAPSGYARAADGSVYRDGTLASKSGPEMTWNRDKAFAFKSLMYAQQQSAKLIDGVIHS